MRHASLSRILVEFYVIFSVPCFLQITAGFFVDRDFAFRKPRQAETLQGDCDLPKHPDFGDWTVISKDSEEAKNPAETVPENTILQFGCNDGYKLSSEAKLAVCIGNKWSYTEPPRCLKKCRAFYTTKYTTIRCYDNREIEIKCDEAAEGASATFKCAPYFVPSNPYPVKRFCNNGSWSHPEPVCQPVCGEKKVFSRPLIANGQTVQESEYPWVTAIFQKVANSFLNVCSGSLLTQKIILTAAHCVTNPSGEKLAKEDIMVAVGKHYNKYEDTRDTQGQYSALEKIEIPKKYKGEILRYSSDIALLITKDVLLISSVVQPVCYRNLNQFNVDPSSVGVITGWGYDSSSKRSDEVKDVTVSYKSHAECEKELPSDWVVKYLTYDKICAGHYNINVTACQGSSGGGLVYKHDNRYFVQGVLSVSVNQKDGCSLGTSLYTKVSGHYDWLEQIIAENNI